jgi:hypothetical protein
VKLIADPTCGPEISRFLSTCNFDRILAHGQFLLAALWRRAGIFNFASSIANLIEELLRCEDSSEMQRFFVFLIAGSYFSQPDGW